MCTYLESYSLVSISASRTLISTRFPFTRLRLLSPVRFLFFSNILFFIYWKFAAAATTSSKLFWSLSTGKSLSISHPKYCIAKPLETNIRTIAPEHWLFSVCMALLLREKNFLPFPMFTIKHPTVRFIRFYLSVRQQIDKYASVRIERVRGRGRASYPNANIRGIK